MQAALTTNISGPAIPWPGGSGTFCALGTFGGGTLKMQWLPPGLDPGTAGNWIDVPGASFTAPSLINVSVGPGSWRANLAGSAAASVSYDFVGFLGGPRGFS